MDQSQRDHALYAFKHGKAKARRLEPRGQGWPLVVALSGCLFFDQKDSDNSHLFWEGSL